MSQQDIQKPSAPNSRPVVGHQISQHIFSSPLPPPEVLEQYEKTHTGLIEEIIQMTKEETHFRREMQSKQLEAEIQIKKEQMNSEIVDAKRGQWFAFLVALFGISAAVIIASQGYQWAASIVSSVGLTGLVTAFIIGKNKVHKQNQAVSKK